MRNNISLFLFSSGILFSIIGCINYARFVYITSVDPDLTIPEYDEKYFINYPGWLNGIDKFNFATGIILLLAIIFTVASGYLKKKLKILDYIIIVADGTLIGMLLFAYM